MDSPTDVVIRPYAAADRPSVRRLACDTTDRSMSGEAVFQDLDLLADVLTRYYTDYEPEHVLVADWNGVVVGYAVGCVDSRRYAMVMRVRVLPRALWTAIRRRVVRWGDLWRLVADGVRGWRTTGGYSHLQDARYPAHVHVNLLSDVRGRRIGDALMRRMIALLRECGASGVHASVREENDGARRFFERLGFVEVGRQSTPWRGAPTGVRTTVIYGAAW